MTEKPEYPKRWSNVEVFFKDGTVETYTITAGASISRHIRNEAASTGILLLLCGAEAHSIPIENIRQWTITELEGKPNREPQVDEATRSYLADPEGHGR